MLKTCVIVRKLDTRFLTQSGRLWSAEYPDAKKFTPSHAIARARLLDVSVEVIENYGMANQAVAFDTTR